MCHHHVNRSRFHPIKPLDCRGQLHTPSDCRRYKTTRNTHKRSLSASLSSQPSTAQHTASSRSSQVEPVAEVKHPSASSTYDWVHAMHSESALQAETSVGHSLDVESVVVSEPEATGLLPPGQSLKSMYPQPAPAFRQPDRRHTDRGRNKHERERVATRESQQERSKSKASA